MSRLKKEARAFLDLIAQEGWVFESMTGGKHLRVRHTRTGEVATIAFTPSDHRTRRNELTRLRRRVRAAGEHAAAGRGPNGRPLPRHNVA